jgi:hypothetical protein
VYSDQINLADQVRFGKDKPGPEFTKMWPTPRSGKTTDENEESWRARNEAGGVSTPPLTLAVKMWPTPTGQDAENNAGPSQFNRNSLPLNAEVGGSLNPNWVEWLMGYPVGWTDCDPSATPSYRK